MNMFAIFDHFCNAGAFANAGLLMGTLALPIMGIICIHCMHMLINCNQYLCTRLGLRHLDYDEVIEVNRV